MFQKTLLLGILVQSVLSATMLINCPFGISYRRSLDSYSAAEQSCIVDIISGFENKVEFPAQDEETSLWFVENRRVLAKLENMIKKDKAKCGGAEETFALPYKTAVPFISSIAAISVSFAEAVMQRVFLDKQWYDQQKGNWFELMDAKHSKVTMDTKLADGTAVRDSMNWAHLCYDYSSRE